METQLLNLIGLANRLRLPANWLKQEADAGRLPCLKVGRKRRFNLTAVQAVLAKRAAEEGVAHEEK